MSICMIFFRNYFLLLIILSMIVIPALTASVSAQTPKEKMEVKKEIKKKISKGATEQKNKQTDKIKSTKQKTGDKNLNNKQKSNYVIYLLDEGNMRLNEGNYQEAIKNYEKALQSDPKDSSILNNLGVAYYNLGDYENAKKYFDKALELDPNNKNAQKYKKALLQEKAKTPENKQKKTDNKNTLKSDPNNKSTQDDKKVLQQLRIKTTSLSSEPKDSITNNFLADADSFLKQGKYQDAIFYYEQINRKNSAILNNLAMAYYNLGDYEMAFSYYNAIESNSNNKTTQDDKEAIQTKTTSPTNEQKNKEIKDLHDKAWTLRNEGKHQDAIKIYKQILDIDRKNFSALWRIGASYLQLGDYENAREYYDDALDINHEDTYVLTMLGYIYEKLGNYDKAMKYYNTAIVMDPNYKYAQDYKKALEQKLGKTTTADEQKPKIPTPESPKIYVISGTCTVNQDCEILIATATGGSPPYTFQSDTFRNGAPPMGMIVDLNGYLTGTPTSEGTYNVGVCVVDLVAKSSCDQATVTVNPVDDIIIEPDITAPGNSARDLTGDWEGTLWVHETYSGDISIDCQYAYQLTLHLTQYPDGTQVGWYTTGTGTGTGHNGKYDCSPSEERSTINFTIFGSEYSGTMGGGPVKGSFTTDQINGNATPDGGDAIITFKFSATRQ